MAVIRSCEEARLLSLDDAVPPLRLVPDIEPQFSLEVRSRGDDMAYQDCLP